MYKLTIETESLDELYATISNLAGKATVTLDAGEQPVKKSKKKEASPLDEVVNFAAAQQTEATKELLARKLPPVKNSEDSEIDMSAIISYEKVKKATLELVKEKGKPVVLEILTKFGAKSATDLKVEQFAEYLKEVEKRCATEDL